MTKEQNFTLLNICHRQFDDHHHHHQTHTRVRHCHVCRQHRIFLIVTYIYIEEKPHEKAENTHTVTTNSYFSNFEYICCYFFVSLALCFLKQ